MNSCILFSLNHKLALVTGSSRGLGNVFARAMAEAGATVILNGTNASTLEAAVKQMKEENFAVHGRAFDIGDPEACAQNISEIEATIGPIDVLINNAGIQLRAPMHEFDDRDWDRIVRINLSSMYYVSKHVVRGMMDRRAGKIINIGSVQSELGRPTIVPYTATKGGVKMLTKGMATEYGKYNIQVNGIGPGYFSTELTRPLVEDEKFNAWLCARTPAERWGDPAELKGAAIFLASDASSYVNGHMLYVDGGMTACV
ncbi:MAG: gluconate 5-dehydrogenase [Gammaproteobacteria bacterium]|nr:MAG: gluconate 5-dehydrogenase [Gammaproteobacteria bacterium]